MTNSFDYSHLEFSRPANQVKTINVDPIPQRIFEGMQKYEDAARVFNIVGFEPTIGSGEAEHLIVSHRPPDAQVSQLYRMPVDPTSTDLQRLTYFDIGSGRTISTFRPIFGDDWRGIWRKGGALMIMDLDGNEMFQLWRYWEDSHIDNHSIIPKIEGELNNLPGIGRIERLTHDGFRYSNLRVSESNKLLSFTSNKENEKDTLVYITKLIDSNTGAKPDASPFNLPSRLVTPSTGQGTTRWVVESISIDDKFLLLTKFHSAKFRPLYIVDISGEDFTAPELIILPYSTENEEDTAFSVPEFSRDPANPHLIYLITNAYGDFNSVVSYDIYTHLVRHITTPGHSFHALRPIPWEVEDLEVTSESILFKANVEGWKNLFVIPLTGNHKDKVIEIKPEWDGGSISYQTHAINGKPHELVLKLISYRSRGYLTHTDIKHVLENIQTDEKGDYFICPPLVDYQQAAAPLPDVRMLPPRLIKYKSFDGMEIPVMYYHPSDGRSAVPLVIGIHGGPEYQATSQYRVPIHGYLLNELGCAIIYPNVRGSSGYGKKFMAADDVLKREDSVRDIGALLDHIEKNMSNELDSTRIAVMGGSYGGYMTFACLTFYSSRLACGVANFGIAHWPSFLQNTATVRRDGRRREYGDETVPEIREFLEKISPLNNASKITAPLSIAHGETDSRVTVEEALRMWEIVSKNGVPTELMVCEKEGHGFKQKSVIEFTNAAKIHFLERYLMSKGL